jgi:hypothetical protein
VAREEVSRMGHYTSFVMKIWVEQGNMVRGEIRHMRTRESIYFLDVKKMWEFVMKHLNGRDEDLRVSTIVQHRENPKTQNPQ